MRPVLCILVALLAFDVAAGVGPLSRRPESGPLLASESAGLFVGIRTFIDDPTLLEVKYGVDDAIELAHLLAIEQKPALVDAKRVLLALSGEPRKASSYRKLEALEAAGARRRSAGQTDILKFLGMQANAVGPNGMLIVAFATHGVNDGGVQHFLTATSLLRHLETSVTETSVRDIISQARVPRALILFDACRQRLTSDTRAGDADPRAAAAQMRHELGQYSGQVVLSAAVAGAYAYDDDARENGVFTAALIDGLRCGAPTDLKGYVTVDTLHQFVEERVLTWIRKHRDPEAKRATQIQAEGRTPRMPLALCTEPNRNDSASAPPLH